MKIFKKIWEWWMKFAFLLGNAITAVLMTVFYFTFFALFAIPFRLFSKGIDLKIEKSSWLERRPNKYSLKDFIGE